MAKGKLLPLEGIRALATIGIFLFHSGFLFQGTFPVTLFFMLSGFLLYYTKEQYELGTFPQWVRDYVAKKWRRFFPLHLLTFLGAVLLAWTANKLTKEMIVPGVLNLLLIHPFFEEYALSFNGLSWFLAVTMFLYCVAFFLLRVIRKVQNVTFHIAFGLAVIVVLNLLLRMGASISLYTNPIYRMLDFWVGMLTAKAYLERQIEIKNATMVEFGLVGVFLVQYAASLFVGEKPGYYSILFTMALYVFAEGKGLLSKWLSTKIFRTIAYYSFEFYMVHEVVLRVFRRVFPDESLPYLYRCAIIAAPSLAIAGFLAVIYKEVAAKIGEGNGKKHA